MPANAKQAWRQAWWVHPCPLSRTSALPKDLNGNAYVTASSETGVLMAAQVAAQPATSVLRTAVDMSHCHHLLTSTR